MPNRRTHDGRKTWHVVPVDDLKQHDEVGICWCKPRIERHGNGFVVTHNSADGRELIERQGLQ